MKQNTKQHILSVQLINEIHGICIYEFIYMGQKYQAETKYINGRLDVLVSEQCPKLVSDFIKTWLRNNES